MILFYRISIYKDRRYWFNRIKNLDKSYHSFVNKNFSLTEEQKKSIDVYFEPYCKVRHHSHTFYIEKTGIFDNRYIPDSLHRCIIDRYYNSWSAATYIDNKCYYPKFFDDINIPLNLAYRLNGIWYEK